jgi:WD40 repeat protein
MKLAIAKSTALVLCTVGLSGCLTSNVLVTVRPDGSGTVEYTTILRPAALSEFEKLLSPELAAARPPAPDISDPRKWRAEDRIGRDVRLVSAKPIKTVETIGWALTYEFEDVTTLDLDLMPLMPGMRGFYGIAAKNTGATTRLRTSLETIPDGMERLTVRFPRFDMDTAAEPPASWASGTPDEMAALRNVMKGSRLTLAVETESPLARTNSPFRDGNRVTLLDADIAEALFSRQISMLVTTPASFDELLTIFSDLPGITLARERDITLDFPNPSLQPAAATAPTSQPTMDTEIFLASLSTANGRLVIGPPVNISRSPGYDNQPSFTPDGQSILFSSARLGSFMLDRPSSPLSSARRQPGTAAREGAASTPAQNQTDIYRYDISSRTVWRITDTPEAEYSPTVMPDGERISVVRVEGDGTQRLWSVSRGDSTTSLILPDVKPVGYHAWIDDRMVALFVLGGRGQPATMQIADTVSGKTTLITADIGRSLQRMPSGAVSFVQREPAVGNLPQTATIKQLIRTATDVGVTSLIPPAGGATDPFVAWTPDGVALMGIDSTVYRWRPGEHGWTVVANLGAFRLRDVSRLAVSPKGDRLAIVARAKQGTSIAR